MTRKELKRIAAGFDHVKVGYVCYQNDGKSPWDLIELGSNSGIYGWNWTAYADPATSTLYISSYRNTPAGIER